MAKSLILGGYAFLASFLFSLNFFDYFSIFSCENVLKRFFGLPPRHPICRHPPPTPYTPPVGLPSQISLTGGQPKKGQISLTGEYLTGGVYSSMIPPSKRASALFGFTRSKTLTLLKRDLAPKSDWFGRPLDWPCSCPDILGHPGS